MEVPHLDGVLYCSSKYWTKLKPNTFLRWNPQADSDWCAINLQIVSSSPVGSETFVSRIWASREQKVFPPLRCIFLQWSMAAWSVTVVIKRSDSITFTAFIHHLFVFLLTQPVITAWPWGDEVVRVDLEPWRLRATFESDAKTNTHLHFLPNAWVTPSSTPPFFFFSCSPQPRWWNVTRPSLAAPRGSGIIWKICWAICHCRLFTRRRTRDT